MENILLARQSIFDAELQVVAYELLFRKRDQGADEPNTELDGDEATSKLILNTFGELGLENVTGEYPAFVNFTRNLLLSPMQATMPKERVVIEILEDVVVDKTLIDMIAKLSKKGYKIALDDFVYRDEMKPLLELVDIVKIDVLNLDEVQILEQLAFLKPYDVKLVAEKIETYERFGMCMELGFDYFQGFFLSRPNLIKSKQVGSNQTVILELLSKLQDEDAEPEELSDIIGKDPALSYKLMRVINSAAYGLPKQIDSLSEAIIRLGSEKIRSWATLITFSNMDNKPYELLVDTMTRAKMCEVLAHKMKRGDAGTFFTAGLFSNLDALLDEEMPILLKKLPLSDELLNALLYHEGIPGKILHDTVAYVQSDWDSIQYNELEPDDYCQAYLESVNWAGGICSELSN